MLFNGLRFAVLVLVFAAIPWGAARADIFRCQAPDGRTLYSDAPCPQEALRSSNITTAVGACSTSECVTQREQAAGHARERLRSEQDLLASLTERRLRAELDAVGARMDELVWRQSLAYRQAVSTEESSVGGYPVFFPVARWCGWRCTGLHPRRPIGIAPVKHNRGVAARIDHR